MKTAGMTRETVTARLRAHGIQPTHQRIEIAHALGTAIAAQGRLDEAADVFRSVIDVEPSYVRAWRDLADCLEATDPVAARAARSTAAAYARGAPPGTGP